MKGPAKTAERRRAPRMPVSFPVTVNCGRKQYRCQARELSEYGILLASTHNDLAGDLRVELVLDPANPPLSLEGLVAYTTDAGFGVRFTKVTPEQRAALQGYIQAQDKNTENR